MVQRFRTPLDGLSGQIDPSRLTRGEQDLLLTLWAASFEGESLTDFILRVAPNEPPPPHLQILIQAFERARREKLRLCISMPPRAGKSITIKRGLAWWLKQRPADLCCFASYNSDFARDQSRDIRELAANVGIPLAQDHNEANNWRTPQGGGLFAAGLAAGITGRGVTGIAVVDDPYANAEDARSAANRTAVQRNFNTVIESRMEGWASIVVVHTRWTTDDLIGELEKRGGWEVINIPAIAERGDPLGRKEGEPLWPEREQFTLASLEERKRVDEYGFASLYQGKPIAEGTRLFYGPPHYWDPKKTDLTGCTVVIGADPAATKKTSADFTAGVVMAVRPPLTAPTVYIIEVYRKQVTVPQGARDLRDLQARNWNAPLKVESVAGFKAVPDLLRELVPTMRVDEIVPKGDKVQRAQLFASAWNDGRVLLPMTDVHLQNATATPPWVAEYEQELREFTGIDGQRDDQVDASAHAYNEIVEIKNAPVHPRGAVYDPNRWG